MKIAIVSMQRIVNNGSYLQAYALRETLSKLSGASVGFLDFENGIHIKEEAKQKEQRLLNAMRDIKHTLLDGFSYTDPCSVYGYGTKEHTRDQENALNHHYDLRGKPVFV